MHPDDLPITPGDARFLFLAVKRARDARRTYDQVRDRAMAHPFPSGHDEAESDAFTAAHDAFRQAIDEREAAEQNLGACLLMVADAQGWDELLYDFGMLESGEVTF
jgi:hypothetical protein